MRSEKNKTINPILATAASIKNIIATIFVTLVRLRLAECLDLIILMSSSRYLTSVVFIDVVSLMRASLFARLNVLERVQT